MDIYRYAKNKSGKIIHISEVDRDSRSLEIFTCPCCDKEMRTRIGYKNAHHFYHINKDVAHDGETYLHSLAKYTFAEVYNDCVKNGIPYNIEFNYGIQEYDLIKLFPCEVIIEKKEGTFIPDVKIHNIKGQFIFIEIAHTHKCDAKKIESGCRIIEINVKSEADINYFTSRRFREKDKNIKFYNFKREPIIRGELLERHELSCSAILYYKNKTCDIFSGRKYLVDQWIEKESFFLETFEFIYYIEKPSEMYKNIQRIAIELYSKNKAIKSCFLCRYHAINGYKRKYYDGFVVYTVFNDLKNPVYCKLYKKPCKQNECANCPSYRVFENLEDIQLI
jgi:hypothetical protein